MERLQRRLDELSSQLLAAREGHATATLETALLGDRRDELAEALQLATAKAAEDARLLAEEHGARRRAEAAVQPNPKPNPNPDPEPEPDPDPNPNPNPNPNPYPNPNPHPNQVRKIAQAILDRLGGL